MTAYLDKEGVFIDDSKLVIHGKTYPLHNISSYEAVHKMKYVWDFKEAVGKSAVGGCMIGGVLGVLVWFFEGAPLGGSVVAAIILSIIFFIGILIWDYRETESTRGEFAFTALSVTVAGTTKHALVVKDDRNDLVYEAKDALDQALTAFSLR